MGIFDPVGERQLEALAYWPQPPQGPSVRETVAGDGCSAERLCNSPNSLGANWRIQRRNDNEQLSGCRDTPQARWLEGLCLFRRIHPPRCRTAGQDRILGCPWHCGPRTGLLRCQGLVPSHACPAPPRGAVPITREPTCAWVHAAKRPLVHSSGWLEGAQGSCRNGSWICQWAESHIRSGESVARTSLCLSVHLFRALENKRARQGRSPKGKCLPSTAPPDS